MQRDYDAIARDVSAALPGCSTRDDRMRLVADVCWTHLAERGVSWIGFYTLEPGSDEMLLGPRRDKPACSPIGLHGACGQSATAGQTLVVTHVDRLGEGYVACDPKDTSELVIPCFEPAADGTDRCWGVLDADSFDEGSFDAADAAELAALLHTAGLSSVVTPAVRMV
ncbi:MAG: hypothetical protein AAGF47_04655 [Planctomycetota bacterium]